MSIRALLTAVCLIGVAGCTTLQKYEMPASASREEFDVLRMLQRASETSRRLEKKAALNKLKPSNRWFPVESDFSGMPIKKFPKQRHIDEYRRNRSWIWNYARGYGDCSYFVCWETNVYKYTGNDRRSFIEKHATILRDFLTNDNPDIRALAAETLAILHNPEDIPLIAELLNDQEGAPPFLGDNLPGPRTPPHPDFERSWRIQTVGDYAKRSLELMTGMRFKNKTEFKRWWADHSGGKDRLWYWEERINRERLALESLGPVSSPIQQWPGESVEQAQGRVVAAEQAMFEYNYQNLERELQSCSPELEAQVFLLLPRRRDFGSDRYFSSSEDFDWPNIPALRLSSVRLLELLERKNLWRGVDYQSEMVYSGFEPEAIVLHGIIFNWDNQVYSRMVERMGLWADTLFTPADVPRLKAVLEKERENLREPAAQALEDGIARLEQSK